MLGAPAGAGVLGGERRGSLCASFTDFHVVVEPKLYCAEVGEPRLTCQHSGGTLFVRSFVHLFIHSSFTLHSFIYSFIHPVNESYSKTVGPNTDEITRIVYLYFRSL